MIQVFNIIKYIELIMTPATWREKGRSGGPGEVMLKINEIQSNAHVIWDDVLCGSICGKLEEIIQLPGVNYRLNCWHVWITFSRFYSESQKGNPESWSFNTNINSLVGKYKIELQ